MNDLEMVDHLIYFLILCYKKSPGTLFLGFKYRIWVPDFWTPLYTCRLICFAEEAQIVSSHLLLKEHMLQCLSVHVF